MATFSETLEVCRVVCQLYRRFMTFHSHPRNGPTQVTAAAASTAQPRAQVETASADRFYHFTRCFVASDWKKRRALWRRKKGEPKNMDIETDLKEAGEILHAEAVFARQPWIHQDLRHSYHKPRGGHSRNRHVEGAEMTLVGC